MEKVLFEQVVSAIKENRSVSIVDINALWHLGLPATNLLAVSPNLDDFLTNVEKSFKELQTIKNNRKNGRD